MTRSDNQSTQSEQKRAPGTTVWLRIIAAALGASCLLGQAAWTAKRNLSDMTIEDLVELRVTTASKKSQTLAESPAAVYVIDNTDITRFGYRTLGDALRSVVGIYTSSDRGFDYLGVRGYSRFGDYNGRILLLIDGHRINDPIFDTAPIGEDCPIDMDNVERIEVVKGPGSSLWGTNALLATVNVITRKGSEAAGGKITADSEKLYAEYGDRLENGLDMDFSISGLRSSGERSIYFSEFDAPETNNGIASNADGLDASRLHINLARNGWQFSYNNGRRNKVLPTGAYGTIFDDPGTNYADRRDSVQLSYETPDESKRSVFARVYSDQYQYIGNYVYDYPPRVINQDDDLAKWWGGELRLYNALSEKLSLTCGAEYQRVGYSAQANHDLDPYLEYYVISQTQTTRSAYAQAEYAPSDLFRFTAGARYDHYSNFGGHWSPRAALIYSPSSRTSIKALYGSAFRAPNSYELAWQNPALPPTEPETMDTQELVWEQSIGKNSRLVASLFKFDMNDVISIVESDYVTNYGTAASRGLEVFYETRSSYETRGFIGACISRSNSSEGPVLNSPDYVVTAGLSMPIASHRFYLSPQIRSIGQMHTKSGATTDRATVMDLALTTARTNRATNLSLQVLNVFNTSVFAPAPSELTQDKVPQTGRTLRLVVSQGF